MKLIYKPFGLILGVIGGLLGKQLFDSSGPSSTTRSRPRRPREQATWPKILAAAAVQGIVFKITRAVVDRYGAKGFALPHRLVAGREAASDPAE